VSETAVAVRAVVQHLRHAGGAEERSEHSLRGLQQLAAGPAEGENGKDVVGDQEEGGENRRAETEPALEVAKELAVDEEDPVGKEAGVLFLPLKGKLKLQLLRAILILTVKRVGDFKTERAKTLRRNN